MFETYLDLPNRNAKNARLLANYQPDIDALSERFSEADLLNLMLITDSNGDIWMKPSSDIINVINSSAGMSNQINIFQDTTVLQEWCKLQSKEFSLLAIEIYAHKLKRQNKIPAHVIEMLDTFIDNELYHAEFYANPLLMPLRESINAMLTPATFWSSDDFHLDRDEVLLEYVRTLRRYKLHTIKYLTSTEWLNNFQEVTSLKPDETSWLIFSHFCAKYFFQIIIEIIDGMRTNLIITNDYLYHPKMVTLITLSMLPYEVIQYVISRKNYRNTITNPDTFIVKATLDLGKSNLTGYTKDTQQILRKTYIYIALLLNPDWGPTAKEIVYFLEGNIHSDVKGFLNIPPITKSKNPSPPSMINVISLLSTENYIEKFMALARNK
ncbi:hypothetical protein FS593_12735 [Lelliottia amnigena]|uniref:hypothetical protein n=1 Tax=Lelliottia amnigena TaxID=61646 RepID=UPI001F16A69E|nr:hypothetical protein [Lelliottia amnigena]UJD95119.1 hypothetical protein FS593_12735 [Lelliottia amnigena]